MTDFIQALPDEAVTRVKEYTTNIGATSVEVFPYNGKRRQIDICNTHATNTLYFRWGGAATTALGVPLPPNTSILFDSKVSKQSLNIIASGADTTVYIVEYN